MFSMEKERQDFLDTARIALLYDLYGALLTDKANETLSLYLNEDWTISEIAEFLSVSRQAVYDSLQRSLEHLERYEANLHLYAQREQRLKLLDALEDDLLNGRNDDARRHIGILRGSL